MSTLIPRAGDLRPWVADFIASGSPKKVNVIHSQFIFKCVQKNDGKLGREALFENITDVVKAIQNKKDVIHIMGVTNITKICRDTVKVIDKHQHWCPIIYNPFTNRIYLYNPLMYHQDSPKNFSTGLMITTFLKRLKEQFAEAGIKIEGATAPKINKTLIKKVRKWAVSKLGREPSSRLWYSLLVFAEMEEMVRSPQLNRKEIVQKIKELPDQYFDSLQNRVETYYSSHVFNKINKEKVCESKLLNPETARCVTKDGMVGKKLLGIKSCENIQVYNISTKRCNKLKHANFMAKKSVSADSEEKTFLDDAFGDQPLVDYLQGKYNHAAVFPTVIEWHYNAKQNSGTLKIPPKLESFWRKQLNDPKKQQIVVLASLSSTSFEVLHANAIIYTKATQELEVFEPNGMQHGPSFGGDDFYKKLDAYFDRFEVVKKLRTPVDYCPKKMYVFQSMETDEKGLWASEGYCAAWSVWYTEHRLMNPTMTSKQCVKVAMDHLLDLGSLREYIWNYDRWMRRNIRS